jgi:flagellin-specific chaperone FliS
MAGQNPASLPHVGLILGSSDKVLTAESGAYSISGQDAALAGTSDWGPASLPHLMSLLGAGQALTLTAEHGTYSFTGQAASSSRNYVVAANVGFYTVAGKAASLTQSNARAGDPGPLPHIGLMLGPTTTAYTLTCDPGIYTIVGSDALADFEVDADQGSYTLTGQDAALRKTTIMTAESGTYSLSGQDVTFAIGSTARTMPADQGSYTITGQSAGLRIARKISAEQGFYAIQGRPADLAFNPPAEFTLTAEGGTYSISGQSAVLDTRVLYAEYGTYTIVGYEVVGLPVVDGAGRKKPRRRKYVVEIDGQEFDVDSEDEALDLIQQAKRIAEEQAAKAAASSRKPARALAEAKRTLKKPVIQAPEIEAEAQAVQQQIADLYDATIKALEEAALKRKAEELDEEEALLLLL